MTKAVYIGGTKIGYATSCEVAPDISDAEETKTFDGPIIDVPESISWTVDIEKLRYHKTIADYKNMEKLLFDMFFNKKTITVIESSKTADGDTLIVKQAVYKATIKDKKYKIDPESRTVENLSFKGEAMDEWINGEKVDVSPL